VNRRLTGLTTAGNLIEHWNGTAWSVFS